jgi:integrase
MTGDVKAVQTLLGHSTASMTLDLYAHALSDTLARAADLMEAGMLLPRRDPGSDTAQRDPEGA